MFEKEIKQLAADIKSRESTVLAKASRILSRNVELISLNAIIGGKNSTHAHVNTKTFVCFEEFFAEWLESMYKDYQKRSTEPYPMTNAGYRNALLLKDPDIMDYAERFLKRNFLKNYTSRISGTTPIAQSVAAWQTEIDNFKQKFSNIVP